MAKIRSIHISPGIYIAYTGVKYPKIRKERSVTALVSKESAAGGGGPVNPVLWVFGNKFPIIFS